MLNKNNLLKDVDEKYIPMLKEVDIPDFTKCIAQFSGLHIKEIGDNIIKEYLLTWAKNKYRFYKMLGNKLKIDNHIKYKDETVKLEDKRKELSHDFPSFALWLEGFRYMDTNKMYRRQINCSIIEKIKELFPECKIDGCLLTHFFKSYLKAPDELVTKLGRIWENQEIEGTYTISIDPVDMMLASENPYDWDSCYRLEIYNDSSHADGCLAAVLDDSSLITYVWNREGKFTLYDKYNFKNIRYYRMREWISISPTNIAIHFNDIYPGKSYTEEFEKLLRSVVEDFVNKDAIWINNKTYRTDCKRTELYGYGEFHSKNIYKIKNSEDEYWSVYNERILCPCGCGNYLPGSDYDDDEDGYEYNGDGFIAENFYEREAEEEAEYCEYMEDFCREHGAYCQDCYYWRKANPVCELDENEECTKALEEELDEENFDPCYSNVVKCSRECCENCMMYDLHNSKKDDYKITINTENKTVSTTINNIKIEKPYMQEEDNYFGTIQGYPDEEPIPRIDM